MTMVMATYESILVLFGVLVALSARTLPHDYDTLCGHGCEAALLWLVLAACYAESQWTRMGKWTRMSQHQALVEHNDLRDGKRIVAGTSGIVVGTMALPLLFFSIMSALPGDALAYSLFATCLCQSGMMVLAIGVSCVSFSDEMTVARVLRRSMLMIRSIILFVVGLGAACLAWGLEAWLLVSPCTVECVASCVLFLSVCAFLLGITAKSFTPGELCITASLVTLVLMTSCQAVAWGGWDVQDVAIMYIKQRVGAGGGFEKLVTHATDEIVVVLSIFCGAFVTAWITLLREYRMPSARSGTFGPMLVVAVLLVVYAWLITSLREEPCLWLLRYITSRVSRIAVVMYWTLVLGLFACMSSRLSMGRKHFHALVVVLFVPAFLLDVSFVAFATACVMSLFLMFELLRIGRVGTVGSAIERVMVPFLDDRDAGMLRLTHIYLLFGCGLPAWLWMLFRSSLKCNDNYACDDMQSCFGALFCLNGTIVLGVGDAMASIVGKKWGRHSLRWCVSGTTKTLEGFLAGTLSMIGAAALIVWIAECETRSNVELVGRIAGPALAICLLEAITLQIDNLVLPIYYSTLLLLSQASGT